MYKFGSVVLVPFPFTDLTSSKLRPALIISNSTEAPDIVVAFISSQKSLNGLGIENGTNEFEASGLKVSSVVRFDKIATLSKKVVLGELGTIPTKFLQKNAQYFFEQFGFKCR